MTTGNTPGHHHPQGLQRQLQALLFNGSNHVTDKLQKQLKSLFETALSEQMAENQRNLAQKYPETLKLIEVLLEHGDLIESKGQNFFSEALKSLILGKKTQNQPKTPEKVDSKAEKSSNAPKKDDLDAKNAQKQPNSTDLVTESAQHQQKSVILEPKPVQNELFSGKIEQKAPQNGDLATNLAEKSDSEPEIEQEKEPELHNLAAVFKALGEFEQFVPHLESLVAENYIKFIDFAPKHWKQSEKTEKTERSAQKLLEKVLKSLDRLLDALAFDPIIKKLLPNAQKLERAVLQFFEKCQKPDNIRVSSPMIGQKLSELETEANQPNIRKVWVLSRFPTGVVIAVRRRVVLEQQTSPAEIVCICSAGHTGPFPRPLGVSVESGERDRLTQDGVAMLRAHMSLSQLLMTEQPQNSVLKALESNRDNLRTFLELDAKKRQVRIQYALNHIYSATSKANRGQLSGEIARLWDCLRARGFSEIKEPTVPHFDESLKDSEYEAQWQRSDAPESTILDIARPGIRDKSGVVIQRMKLLVSEGP